jgi:hypothetical protein
VASNGEDDGGKSRIDNGEQLEGDRLTWWQAMGKTMGENQELTMANSWREIG